MIGKKTLMLIVIFDIIIVGFIWANTITNELSGELLRLHIISNSNSQEDTKIKLSVRDEVIKIIRDTKYQNKKEVIDDLKKTENKVKDYLKKNGINYGCRIDFLKASFPAKRYNNILMPSGRYECIKVVLGEGAGENWWCIAYPPLCFTQTVSGYLNDEGERQLSDKLSQETFSIIHADTAEYKIRFKTIDVINSIKEKFFIK